MTRATDLDPAGTEVTVTGEGFDESIGIYVAVCVDNGLEKRPTPCLGGVDMSGATGSSGWFSSNPPSYGKDLAQPFGPGGSFELTTTVVAQDNLSDCLDEAAAPDGCVLATFADHTRIDNRSADVRIPLTFAAPGAAEPSGATTAPAGAAEAAETAPPTTEGPAVSSASPVSASSIVTSPSATSLSATSGGSAAGGAPLVWGGVGAVVVLGGIAFLLARRRTAATPGDAAPVDDGDRDA